MRDLAATEFRRQLIRQDRAERRIALSHLTGKVKEVDPQTRRLRLIIGTSSSGAEVLSPWVRWQEAGAGGLFIHSEPAIGAQMTLMSSSGSVGDVSIAVSATYDRDHKAPSQSSDTAVFEREAARLELGPDGFLLQGPVKIKGDVDITGFRLTHNERNVGSDHKHTEVLKGGDISGPPQE
ncbi:phage baseplate protein [Rhizobium sp. S163]|uniref:phage baseplate protein n=1 Tax=Rhizobium sp. S163 TaxID=3055039 RepID=UPI0025AA14FA|nr:phage baseplate protein [Rhizobium sp. S163]MDM9647753.1 phage baseplate protein [Rhizobium sp. S163]